VAGVGIPDEEINACINTLKKVMLLQL